MSGPISVLSSLTKELQILELKNQIQDKVKVDLDKQQRDYFLNQQMKTIQEELGDAPGAQDIAEITEKACLKELVERGDGNFSERIG